MINFVTFVTGVLVLAQTLIYSPSNHSPQYKNKNKLFLFLVVSKLIQ